MKAKYTVYVFNHDEDHYPYKAIGSFSNSNEALFTACNIVALVSKDYRQEMYAFLEEKKLTFGIEYSGVHVYNGNVPWSAFITNCSLEKPIIGPVTKNKDLTSFGGDENN